MFSLDDDVLIAEHEWLKQYHQALRSQLQQQTPITELMADYLRRVDEALVQLWQSLELEPERELALIAVGGYGRGELHPYSDLDLLILKGTALSARVEERLAAFIAKLWDWGFKVGVAARTLAECAFEAQQDLTIATTLLETRSLSGSTTLYQQLITQVEAGSSWSCTDYLKAKVEEQRLRHLKASRRGSELEPELKLDVGGLRDMQILYWILRQRQPQQSDFSQLLVPYLEPFELQEFFAARALIGHCRFALHLVVGKAEDRLAFAEQPLVAESLGYRGEGNRAVSVMMRALYQAMQCVRRLNQRILMQLVLEDGVAELQPLTAGLARWGDYLLLVDETQWRGVADPLGLYRYLADYPELKGLAPPSQRWLARRLRAQSEPLQNDPECRRHFIALLRHPRALWLIQKLAADGLLSRYLPQWSAIEGMMQFDLFHTATVATHTLRLLSAFEALMSPQMREEYPFGHGLMQQLRNPEILYCAALFHDIAKGRDGNHATLGAVDAEAFATLHEFDRAESRQIAWLVANHLRFSHTAERRDIHDPEVIREFALIVRDERHLELLTLLTIADIRATNPKLWNNWKGSLIQELFLATQQLLRRGMENPPDLRRLIRDHQQHALNELVARGIEAPRIEQLWDSYKADYFWRYSVEQIVWHTEAILAHAKREEPLVLLQNRQRGGSELFIYSRDIPYFFATVAALLAQKKLNIVEAQVMGSKSGYVLDTFMLLDAQGEALSPDRLPRLAQSLTKALTPPMQMVTLPEPKPPRTRFRVATRIEFLPRRAPHLPTLLEVSSRDTPGLLARIGSTFQFFNLQLLAAKITTVGERAEDVFSLTNINGEPLSEVEQEELGDLLRQRLSGGG